MADKNDWIVDGFQFATDKDAQLAQKELQRIERLENKIDYQNPNMVYAVYKKAIDNRVFRTPVGYGFLKKLQDSLSGDSAVTEEIPDIPVYGVYSFRESASPAVERVKASQKKVREKPTGEYIGRKISLYMNIVLILLVGVMFWISMTGSNPTVLNYERAVQDKYSQWEQDLSRRENAIREKERELLLDE